MPQVLEFFDRLLVDPVVTGARLLFAAVVLWSIVDLVRSTRESVRVFQMHTVGAVIRTVLLQLPAPVAAVLVAGIVLRPLIAPEGTPLERCLKGQITPEFLAEDQRQLSALRSAYRKSYEDLEARYAQQRERLLLDLSDAQLEALIDSQFKDLRRVSEAQDQVLEGACREAASRIERTAPVAALPSPSDAL